MRNLFVATDAAGEDVMDEDDDAADGDILDEDLGLDPEVRLSQPSMTAKKKTVVAQSFYWPRRPP